MDNVILDQKVSITTDQNKLSEEHTPKQKSVANLNIHATKSYLQLLNNQIDNLPEDLQKTMRYLSNSLNQYLQDADSIPLNTNDKQAINTGYTKLSEQIISRDLKLQEKVAQNLSTSHKLVRARDAATTLGQSFSALPSSLQEGVKAGEYLSKFVCQSLINLTDKNCIGAGLERDLALKQVYLPQKDLSTRAKAATNEVLSSSIAYIEANQEKVLATLEDNKANIRPEPSSAAVMTHYLRKALNEFPQDSTYLDIFKQNKNHVANEAFEDNVSEQISARVHNLIAKAAQTARRANLIPNSKEQNTESTEEITAAKRSYTPHENIDNVSDRALDTNISARELSLSELSARAARLQTQFRQERHKLAKEGKLPNPATMPTQVPEKANVATPKEDHSTINQTPTVNSPITLSHPSANTSTNTNAQTAAASTSTPTLTNNYNQNNAYQSNFSLSFNAIVDQNYGHLDSVPGMTINVENFNKAQEIIDNSQMQKINHPQAFEEAVNKIMQLNDLYQGLKAKIDELQSAQQQQNLRNLNINAQTNSTSNSQQMVNSEDSKHDPQVISNSPKAQVIKNENVDASDALETKTQTAINQNTHNTKITLDEVKRSVTTNTLGLDANNKAQSHSIANNELETPTPSSSEINAENEPNSTKATPENVKSNQTTDEVELKSTTIAAKSNDLETAKTPINLNPDDVFLDNEALSKEAQALINLTTSDDAVSKSNEIKNEVFEDTDAKTSNAKTLTSITDKTVADDIDKEPSTPDQSIQTQDKNTASTEVQEQNKAENSTDENLDQNPTASATNEEENAIKEPTPVVNTQPANDLVDDTAKVVDESGDESITLEQDPEIETLAPSNSHISTDNELQNEAVNTPSYGEELTPPITQTANQNTIVIEDNGEIEANSTDENDFSKLYQEIKANTQANLDEEAVLDDSAAQKSAIVDEILSNTVPKSDLVEDEFLKEQGSQRIEPVLDLDHLNKEGQINDNNLTLEPIDVPEEPIIVKPYTTNTPTLGASAVTTGENEPIPNLTVANAQKAPKEGGFFKRFASLFTRNKEEVAEKKAQAVQQGNQVKEALNLAQLNRVLKQSPLDHTLHILRAQVANTALPDVFKQQAQKFIDALSNPVQDLQSVQQWLNFVSGPMSPSSSQAVALHQWAFMLLGIRFNQLGKSIQKFLQEKHLDGIENSDKLDDTFGKLNQNFTDDQKVLNNDLLDDTLSQVERLQNIKANTNKDQIFPYYMPLPPNYEGGREGGFSIKAQKDEDGERSWHLNFVFDVKNLGLIEIKAVAKLPELKLSVITESLDGLQKVQELLPTLVGKLQEFGITTRTSNSRLGRINIPTGGATTTRKDDGYNLSLDI